MRVAYPGREGAHSAAAAALLFPDVEAASLPSFGDVVEAVATGEIDVGVLPIESSIAGPVAETHDLLVGSAVSINAQTIIPIRHLLVGVAEVPLEEIRIVRSHPVALDQCRRLLASLPQATAIAAGTTADAAAQVFGELAVAGVRPDGEAAVGHGDVAEDGAPEQDGELDGVEKDQRYPALGLDPHARQHRADTRRRVPKFAIGQISRRVDESDLVAATFRNMAIDEIDRGIVIAKRCHRRRPSVYRQSP